MPEIIQNPVIKAILERQTIREYKKEMPDSEVMATLAEAALRAPSGRNSQPCHLRFFTNAADLHQMHIDFKNLVGWDTPAHTRSERNPFYHNAPVFAVIFAQGDSYMDAGLMAENICIAASGLGLGTCIVGSAGALFNAPQGAKWKKRMDIPEEFTYMIGICIGYPDEKPEFKPRFDDRIRIID